ncbi:MAG: Asp23/Gls24 family envelope stress response protein [Oscillospiraceae bacterium]|nr:Asp23/Gls24 family envelope stress response protein [Oscillospiraceae bacterium]
MAEIKEYVAKNDENGSVTISEEVIASISAIAASEIDGVAALGTSNVADFLGKKNQGKGVKVNIDGNDAEINITLSIKKGSVIPTVAKAVQENVVSAVESMTGINITAVNVKIAGVAFEKEKKKATAEPETTEK